MGTDEKEVPCQRSMMELLAKKPSLPATTCSKLTIETLEQGVKHVQS